MLGAKLAAPDRPCVSICGDGGFTMVPHVLCTAVEYNIPAVWVVWNNFSWAAIRDIQLRHFDGREIGTGFYQGPKKKPYNPDFAAWARAAGVEGVHRHQIGGFQRRARPRHRAEQTLPDRRACGCQHPAAGDRRLGLAADSAQGTGIRGEIRSGKVSRRKP